MQELLQFMNENGYSVSEIIADSKIHRFKSHEKDTRKSGWYSAHQAMNRQGMQFHIIVCGDWSQDAPPQKYHTLKGKVSKEDRDYISNKTKEIMRKHEEEQKKVWEEKKTEVEILWKSLLPQGTSEYLERKKISNAETGVRYDPLSGKIYVPIRDEHGHLYSLQSIDSDGTKRFHPGARIKDCFHVVGGKLSGPKYYFAEGMATAASVSLATGSAVVCAYSSHALGEISRNFRRIYPEGEFYIIGDDDRHRDVGASEGESSGKNSGRDAAERAARECLGVAIFPEFREYEGHSTKDFNDLHVREGIAEVRRQILGTEPPKQQAIYPLGFKNASYFFTTTNNQQIVEITAFSEKDFLHLMPLEYWEASFVSSNKNGPRVDWTAARSRLMEECRVRGIFQSQRIRGAGVWSDDGRVVVNMGDHLVVDGAKMGLREIKSDFFYTLGIRLPVLHEDPLSAEECSVITEAANMFRWQSPDFGFLLAGAMVTSRVCGALPIRPHLWLTGEAGTGKTTLFNRFIFPLIGDPLIPVGGNTSEAGIRQEVSSNAVPVLFDEFENNGTKSAEMIQSVLDLMRIAWSETNSVILKGTSQGNAQQFQARFAAIVTSIRQVNMTDADRSRFATVELQPHGNDLDHWRELDTLLSRIDAEFGRRLFARTIKMLPTLLENFKTMKKALNQKCPGQRFADQYGMLLAGYGILLWDRPMTDEDARCVAEYVSLEGAREEASITDQNACLDHLLTKIITLDSVEVPVLGAILDARTNTVVRGQLESYGIKVEGESFAVRCQHTELEMRIFRGTRWSNTWGKSLIRVQGAKRQAVRVGGANAKCIIVPIKAIL